MFTQALRRNALLHKLQKVRLTGTKINEKVHSNSIPPLLARIAVVGTSAALVTPLVAIVGVGGMWFSYLPNSTLGEAVKLGLACGVGGGFTSFLDNYVSPFLRNNADFVLPFAISNMVASAFWYTVGELRYGSAVMTQRISAELLDTKVPFSLMKRILGRLSALGVPIAGPVIGALTALTVPFLWPTAFRNFWDKDLQDLVLNDRFTWISTAYEWLFFPIGLPVGVFSGLAMHQALKSAVSGVPNKPWTRTTLPVLVAVFGAATYYFTQCKSDPNSYLWYTRMDPISGTLRSYNARTGEFRNDDGAIGKEMSLKRRTMLAITEIPKVLSSVPLNEIVTIEDGNFSIKTSRSNGPSYRPRTANGEFSALDIELDVLVHRLVDIVVRKKFMEMSPEHQQANTASGASDVSVASAVSAVTTAATSGPNTP